VEGSVIQFTADVSVVSPGAGDPSGSVQFYVDDVPLGDPVSVVDGQALSVEVSDFLEGLYAVKATYDGNDLFNGSSSADLSQKVVAGDLSEVVIPGEETIITFHGLQNGLPVSTTVRIPAGAVADEVTVVYHQFDLSDLEKPEGKDFVTHFTLDVYKNGEIQPGYAFLLPLEISMQYNPKDWDAQSFEVLGWLAPDVKGWHEDGIVMGENDLTNHSISFTIANTVPDQFSLVGTHQYIYFFPVINH